MRARMRALMRFIDEMPVATRAALVAAIYTLIESAKLNDIDPQGWLADVLAQLHDHPAKRIQELLPWNWRPPPRLAQAA
jgi:transposase IS66-like protein